MSLSLFATVVEEHQTWRIRLSANSWGVHDLLAPLGDVVERLARGINTIIQVGDLWGGSGEARRDVERVQSLTALRMHEVDDTCLVSRDA